MAPAGGAGERADGGVTCEVTRICVKQEGRCNPLQACIPEPLLCSPAPAAPASHYTRLESAPWEDPLNLFIVHPPWIDARAPCPLSSICR